MTGKYIRPGLNRVSTTPDSTPKPGYCANYMPIAGEEFMIGNSL